MSKKKKDKTQPVTKYKSYFICRFAGGTPQEFYRVKTDPSLHYSIHHGSFESVDAAKDYVDYILEDD